MLNHHFNSKRPATAIVPERKTRKSRFSYVKNWLFVVICGVLIITTSGLLTPHTALAASEDSVNEDYIFDKVLTWHDGSTEHVQIGTDGFFHLDGEKKQLVGVYLSEPISYGNEGLFWLPENLEILDEELSYLESIGIRLIRVYMRYYIGYHLTDFSAEESAYNTLLNLAYKHKMLVISGIQAKWLPGFGDLETSDFNWSIPISEEVANSDFNDISNGQVSWWYQYYTDCSPSFFSSERNENGDFCVGIELTKLKNNKWAQAIWLQDIPVQAGASYPVGGWIKTDNVAGDGGATINVHWKGPENSWLGESKFMSHMKGTSDWTFCEGEVTAPEGTVKATLCLMLEGCSGQALFDDVKFGQGTGASSDSLSEWATRCATIVNQFDNVVGVIAENELDYKLQPYDFSGYPESENQAQNYTAEAVDRYMSLLTGILREKTDIPVTHNLMLNRIEPEIKEICLSHIDIPAFDCYASSQSELDYDLKAFLPEMNVLPGWWCLELNSGGIVVNKGVSSWEINTKKFTPSYIDTVFDHGAAVAILFWSNDVENPERSFFDDSGVPKVQLVEVAQEINRLQAAIAEIPINIVSR